MSRPTYVPDGYSAVTPYLLVPDAEAAIEFMQAVFNAEVRSVMRDDEGAINHADIRIDDSPLMMGQATSEWPPQPNGFYVYVADVDETHRLALANGAIELMPPADQSYGDRSSGVQDPAGNQWWIATQMDKS